jgi:hypothetical protein
MPKTLAYLWRIWFRPYSSLSQWVAYDGLPLLPASKNSSSYENGAQAYTYRVSGWVFGYSVRKTIFAIIFIIGMLWMAIFFSFSIAVKQPTGIELAGLLLVIGGFAAFGIYRTVPFAFDAAICRSMRKVIVVDGDGIECRLVTANGKVLEKLSRQYLFKATPSESVSPVLSEARAVKRIWLPLTDRRMGPILGALFGQTPCSHAGLSILDFGGFQIPLGVSSGDAAIRLTTISGVQMWHDRHGANVEESIEEYDVFAVKRWLRDLGVALKHGSLQVERDSKLQPADANACGVEQSTG